MDNQPRPQMKPEDQSFIHIQFATLGSALMDTDFNNVTPIQMLAVASFLEYKGKQALAQQEYMQAQKREANKIAVLEPRIVTK